MEGNSFWHKVSKKEEGGWILHKEKGSKQAKDKA